MKKPIACLTLASFLATNTGDIARRHIKDPELLSFIDIECYCWSTVLAGLTPMMNAGMVFCDRHFGGINYPKGGVGRIAQCLAGDALGCACRASCCAPKLVGRLVCVSALPRKIELLLKSQTRRLQRKHTARLGA